MNLVQCLYLLNTRYVKKQWSKHENMFFGLFFSFLSFFSFAAGRTQVQDVKEESSKDKQEEDRRADI